MADVMMSEKSVAAHTTTQHLEDLHEHSETEGYIVDADESSVGVKVAADGHTRLIPQPSDDPNDPLNWSKTKKHIILWIVSFAAFLPDYGSATGAVLLIPQAAYATSVRLLATLLTIF